MEQDSLKQKVYDIPAEKEGPIISEKSMRR